MIDYWLSICIFTPMVVAYWRGTWQLLDLFLWPQSDPCLNAITSFGIGTGTITILSLAQSLLANNVSSNRLGKVTFFILSRTYTVVFAFAGVNQWRGVWNIMSCYVGTDWWLVASIVFANVVILASLRVLKTVIAPPFMICVDEEYDFFKVHTVCKTKVRFSRHHVVDVLFSVVVIGSLVVMIWWGVWTLADIFIFPESLLWSGMTCFFSGIGVAIICFIFQSSVAYGSREMSFWLRVIFEDIYLFIAEVGAINLWRGIWSLLDIFLIPDNPFASNAFSSCTGIIVLLIMHSSNSILVKGMLFNLHTSDGSDCYFHLDYTDKIKTIIDYCNGTPNKIKKFDDLKEEKNLQICIDKQLVNFANDETAERLWMPQAVISNGKLPNMMLLLDRETAL